MLSFYLCQGDDTIQSVMERINRDDPDGKKYICNEDTDRCYIGDEKFSHADKIINYHNSYYAVHAVQ